MDVRCPQCQTLYELETAQLKAPVITLKCSQCQHVFRIETKQSGLVQENQRRWMIRAEASGDILYITGFDVLHQWLMQGKVKKTDQISRSGKKWTELSEIGEFMPIFQVIESISNLMGGSTDDSQIASRIPTSTEERSAEKERIRVETEIQFGTTEEVTQRARPSTPTPAPTPRRQTGPQELPPSPTARQKAIHTPAHGLEEDSWALGSVPSTTFDQENTSQTYVPKSRTPLVALIVTVLVLGGGYIYMFHMSDIESALGMNGNEIVSLGDQKTVTADVQRDPFTATQERIRRGQTSALEAAEAANAKTMAEVLGAIRPKMAQAMGLATEEAEVAAEGGGVDHKLSEAKRNLDRNRPQQALNLYQEVLGIDSRNVNAMVGMGWALLQLGRNDEAADHFRRAVDIDTRQGDALIGLGSAERQRGNLKEAMRAYDLYLGRHPRGDKVSIAQYQLDSLRRQLGME